MMMAAPGAWELAMTFCGRLLVVLAVIGGTPLAAADWPEFRGPGGQGLSAAANLPFRWSPTEAVAWKLPVPGTGWSSPVLAGGRLYLTTATGDLASGNVSLRALAVDAARGEVAWDVEVFKPEAEDLKPRHGKNSFASPTPIVAGGKLYVHFGHMGTAALDLTGKVLWRQTSLKYPPLHGNGGSPALVGDRLVFGCDGLRDPFVVALDAATGQVAWKVSRTAVPGYTFAFSTPLAIEVDGATQVVAPAAGYTAAYDPRDGRELWRVTYGKGFSVVPRPVFAHGLLYLGTGWEGAGLLAVDPRGAKGDVTRTHVRWTLERGAPLTPTPVVVGQEVYVVSDNGIATCLDARSGQVHWTERLGGGFSASPVAAAGRVYFVSEEGVTSVVKAGTAFELLATNELGERALASPALDEGTVFLRTESHLWRLGS
jgi:outer membrane protein assembly factor BamB